MAYNVAIIVSFFHFPSTYKFLLCHLLSKEQEVQIFVKYWDILSFGACAKSIIRKILFCLTKCWGICVHKDTMLSKIWSTDNTYKLVLRHDGASHKHCVKSVRIRIFSGPYLPAFWLNTGKYGLEKLQISTLFT